MRESLTIFAIVLILVLSALLVGPYVVDWNNQKDWLAAKLSKTIGAQVKIAGAIDVKLLPRPIFRVNQVTIEGATPRDPRFSAARLDAELSINSLLQGAAEFVEADVVSPRIEVTLRSDGSLVAPAWDVSNPQKFMFKQVTVQDGSIVIRDEGGRQRSAVTGIAAQGEAETLFGPLKAIGQAKADGTPFKFRLSTGAYSGRRLRIKLTTDGLGPLTVGDIDGVVSASATGAAKSGTLPLGFQGTVSMNGSLHVADGAAPVPWQAVASDVKADANGISTTALEVRAGADNRALVANGGALIDFGAVPSAVLKLRARQLDLDHIAVAPDVAPDTPRPKPAQWLAALQKAVGQGDLSAALPTKLSLDYGIDAVTTGDLTLTDAAGSLNITKGLPIKGRFAINGPDGLHLALDGALETGAAAVFKGQVEAATRDVAATAGWLAPLAPETADWVSRNVPIHAGALSGALDVSGTGFSARGMTFAFDGSTLTGSVASTRGVGGERPRLFADVTADTLDTEHLPALSDVAAAVMPVDLSVAVSARSVKVTHSGFGAVQTGKIALHLKKVDTAVTLDDFSVTGLDGANVTATASLDGDRHGRASGHIQAADLAPLAALARQVFPSGATDALVARAALLSPAALDFKLEGQLGSDGKPVPSLATATGLVGATRLSATLTPEPAHLFGSPALNVLAVLDAPDAGILLRQGGLADAAPNLLGPGHVEVTARGTLDSGFDTHLAASIAGGTLGFDGVSDGATGTGHVKGAGANAAPLLKSLAISGSPASAVWPWEVETDLAWNGSEVTANKVGGRFDGTGFSGSLGYRATGGGPAALSGSIALDTVPAAGLAGLLLGPPSSAPPQAGRWWTEAHFPAAPLGLPPAQLNMQVRSLPLTDALTLRNAAFQMRLTPSSVTFGDLSGEMLGGKIGGSLTLRRDGALAALTGQLALSDLAVTLPSLTGRLSGTLSLAGSGTNPDALVASLGGDGALTVSGASVPHLDPQSLLATAKTFDVEGAAIDNDAVRDNLLQALDRNPLALGTVAAPATIAAGTLRAVDLKSQTSAFQSSSEASLDLRSLSFTLRTTLTSTELPKDWKGDPPQVTVTWRGPLGNPVREIDSAAFANGLAARAIARDQERIQLMQDDLRERAFFARRLRQIEEEQKAARDAAEAAKATTTPKPADPGVAKPDGKTDAAAAPAQDPVAKLLSKLPPTPPAPPIKPLARPPMPPIDLQRPAQTLGASGPDPNSADPTSVGRY